MRIVVDGRLLDVRKTGGTQYTRRLLEGVAALAPQHELVVLRREQTGEFANHANIHELELPEATLGNERWEQLQLPLVLRELHPEVFFSPTSVTPAVHCCPTAVVVYDLGFWQHPEFYAPSLRSYLRRWLPPSAVNAQAVVCLSQTVKHDVTGLLGVAPDLVHVVPGAPDEVLSEPVSPERSDQLCEALGLRRPFVLCVSSSEYNKNLPRLVTAFERVRLQADGEWQLVLAGPPGAAERQLQDTLAKLSQPSSVVRLGFLSEDTLPVLYHACEVFAFPSVSEGFGLPALEAMAAGKAVLCSDDGAVAEVVGDAALGVEVHCVETLASGLSQLLTDNTLRERLGRQAFSRASEFNWSNSSERLLRVLEALAAISPVGRENGVRINP